MTDSLASTTSTAHTTSALWPAYGTDRRSSHWDLVCRSLAAATICFSLAADVLHVNTDDASADTAPTATDTTDQKTAGRDIKDIPLTREWMIAGYGGAPYTYPSDVTATQPGVHDFTVEDVAWDAKPFKSPIYYGARVIRWAGEGRFGSMLDFTHSKTIADLKQTVKATGQIGGQPVSSNGPLSALFERLEFSHGHNMLSVNGLMRLGAISRNVWPYVGLGAGVNLPHSEVQVQGDANRSYEYQYTGPMAQGLVGIELRIAKVSYFVEYKFTLARYLAPLTSQDGTEIGLFGDLYRQFQRWSSGTEPPDGWVKTNLNSHNAIAGIGVRIDK